MHDRPRKTSKTLTSLSLRMYDLRALDHVDSERCTLCLKLHPKSHGNVTGKSMYKYIASPFIDMQGACW